MAIAFVTSSFLTSTGTASPITVTTSYAAGDLIVIVVGVNDSATATSNSVTDNAGVGTQYFKAIGTSNTSRAVVAIWYGIAVAAATSKVVSAAFTGARASMGLARYTGFAALGDNTTGALSTANPTITLATEDANDFIIAGFANQGTGTYSALASNGNFRGTSASAGTTTTGINVGLVDNTNASATNVTCGATHTATTGCQAAFDLRLSIPPTEMQSASDQFGQTDPRSNPVEIVGY